MKDKKRLLFWVCGLLLAIFASQANLVREKKFEIRNSKFEKRSIRNSNLQLATSNLQPSTSQLLKSNLSPPSDSGFTLIKTIPIEAKDIQTDRLGNLYIVSKTNQLYKYGANGKLLSTLNYKYLGNITHVDATNPMEIYVFYKELNMVVFLDNNLAYRGEMKLGDFGIGQAAAICRSFDNGIWVFDLGDMQLKKMDKNGENLQTTGNIRQYVSQPSAVLFLNDNNEKVFVNDSANGVLIFNIFGTYTKTLPIKGCTELKVINNEVYYWQAQQLKKYRLQSFDIQTFALPDAGQVLDVSIEKNRVYLLESAEVSIYGF
jgi:hypothetical protein